MSINSEHKVSWGVTVALQFKYKCFETICSEKGLIGLPPGNNSMLIPQCYSYWGKFLVQLPLATIAIEKAIKHMLAVHCISTCLVLFDLNMSNMKSASYAFVSVSMQHRDHNAA